MLVGTAYANGKEGVTCRMLRYGWNRRDSERLCFCCRQVGGVSLLSPLSPLDLFDTYYRINKLVTQRTLETFMHRVNK
jgi:hypothetical protein